MIIQINGKFIAEIENTASKEARAIIIPNKLINIITEEYDI